MDVPFAFSAKREKFPAGHSAVSQKAEMIRIVNHHHGLYVARFVPRRERRPMAASSSSDRYGDGYFLSAIWITGCGSGRKLLPSGAECELKGKRAAMELAVVRRPAQ